MSDQRLYYDDPFLLVFRARVVERSLVEGRPAIVLDHTAFYPTSGGQPHDLGTLRPLPHQEAPPVAVLEVVEERGKVLHILAGEVQGDKVEGRLDGERRFDHMQQHTGQHILSQAFVELFAAETVSFHLGADDCTIDLNRGDFSAQELERAEERANAIIFEDRPVRARFVTEQELAGMPLRKPPTEHERVRIVEIEGFDWSPCGGTHCQRTGQVGAIHVTHSERHGGEARITFLCGRRALRDARWKHELLKEIAIPLSVGLPDLPDTVTRLVEAEETARKALEKAQRQLLHYEAQEHYQRAEQVGPARVVRALFQDRPLDQVRTLAREIASLPGGVALLGLGGDSARLCFTRSEDLPWDMGALLRRSAAVVGGRGGGRPQEAQGGGPEVERLEESLELALQQLRALAE